MAAEDWIDRDPYGVAFADLEHNLDSRRNYNVTCKRCGQSGFHWGTVRGTWRLFDHEGQLHTCKKQPREGWTTDSLTNLARSFSTPTTQAFDVAPTTTKESIMDKNAVAFIRKDVRSIVCVFLDSEKGNNTTYTPETISMLANGVQGYIYLTVDPQIEPGDWVVVNVRGLLKTVYVREVHEDLAIEPNCATEFKFIVGRIDQAPYHALCEQNAKIKEIIATSYRASVREGFRQTLLSGLPAEQQSSLSILLSSKE
jgi:hypothetical protein